MSSDDRVDEAGSASGNPLRGVLRDRVALLRLLGSASRPMVAGLGALMVLTSMVPAATAVAVAAVVGRVVEINAGQAGVHDGGIGQPLDRVVDETGPIVTGLVGIGDAVTHTNPTLGQGAALALWAAQRVATTVDPAADPVAFALDYHRWAIATLKPWFDRHVTLDRGNAARLAAGAAGSNGTPRDDTPLAQAALLPCSLEDPVVMRARAQVRHLAQLPEHAYHTAEVHERVAR